MADFVYIHNLDPFAIQFTEHYGIRWYGLAYIGGFLIGYLLMIYLSKLKKTSLSAQQISSLINYCIVGVLVGGRLGYSIFYQPSLWWKFSSAFPFWGVLEIHQGGMASHGGILGLFIASFIFARKYKISFFHILDLNAVGSIGIFFGRLANFVNGELYGRVIQGQAWFGTQFPKEIYTWFADKNQEKLLALEKVLPFIGEVKSPFGKSNLPLTLWETWVQSIQKFTAEIHMVLNQVITSFESGNKNVSQALSSILPIRHPSQIYQALAEGLLPFLIAIFLWFALKKDTLKHGWIAGIWGISYFTMRIIGEQFRAPDHHIGFDWLGLTRGQWLSVLACAGLSCYFYILYRHKKVH